MMHFILLLLYFVHLQDVSCQSNSTARGGKALSVFQVVRFPNVACVGSSLNGTCYTSSECTNKGGTNSGSCASGFGVCCTFTLGCGSTIAENCTYFQSSSQASGQCSASICKCSSDICQLRLDFSSFVITGPNTLTVTAVFALNGVSNQVAGVAVSLATQCLTDTFSVTGYTSSPPVICGTNTGYHMYVDANPNCNTLMFQLGNTAVGTTLATRQWNIKVTQISCYSTSLPPQGCTQYYTGTSNYFNSYNYAGGAELANQRQNICMRRERGYCRLCVTTSGISAVGDFSVSGMTANSGYVNSKCCGYGADGKQTSGFDCIIIPNAVKNTPTATQIINNHFCGRYLVTAVAGMAATGSKTVCTTQQPFNIQFLTDAYTMATAAAASIRGFKLIYFETTC